jgi:integration host factor subunit beta
VDSPLPRSDGPAGPAGRGGRTITKKELVARIAERTGVTKVVAKDIIQLFLDEIIRELGRGNRLEFREFGVFEIKERAARKAQNPRTLEKVEVPAKRVVKFKVGRLMKERVALIARGLDFETRRGVEDDDD